MKIIPDQKLSSNVASFTVTSAYCCIFKELIDRYRRCTTCTATLFVCNETVPICRKKNGFFKTRSNYVLSFDLFKSLENFNMSSSESVKDVLHIIRPRWLLKWTKYKFEEGWSGAKWVGARQSESFDFLASKRTKNFGCKRAILSMNATVSVHVKKLFFL